MGYLPQAMRNYLARLGWSHGDDELMALDDMIQWFGLDAIGKSAARFDFRKLNNLNGQYIRSMDDKQLLVHWKVCLDHCGNQDVLDWLASPSNEQVLLKALPGLKQRAKILTDITDSASYLWRQRPLDIDANAAKLLGADNARVILAGLLNAFLDCEDWTAGRLQSSMEAYASSKNLKLGVVAQPLRAALTGRRVSRGIYDVLVDLGRTESFARINDQLKDNKF